MSDETWFHEPFGPIYERPAGAPCPGCECCTLRLCQLAASKDLPCSYQSDDPRTVADCPCSATVAARPAPHPDAGDDFTADPHYDVDAARAAGDDWYPGHEREDRQ